MNTYTLKDNDLALDIDHFDYEPLKATKSNFQGKIRAYDLKLRDLPDDEKPREKLLQNGPEALSTVELLAIVLSVGTKKEGVLEMASRMIREYGERSLATITDAKKISEDLDIPIIKAIQLVASAELGKRFFKKGTGELAVIRSAKDVYEYAREMENYPKEQLRGLYLNTHHKVVHDEVISIGTINSNIIHPREVFRPAIQYGAVAVVLVHNHPSGIAKASKADIEITEQLVKAGKLVGINLVDHIVIAGGSYSSVEVDYN